MDIKDIFSQIRSMVNNAMGGGLSFGQPSKLGDLYVIPVARVIYGMGGGGDQPSSEQETEKEEKNETDKAENKTKVKVAFSGGGGVGTFSKPVGLFSIKEDRIKFHPVIDLMELVALGSFMTIFMIIMKKLRFIK